MGSTSRRGYCALMGTTRPASVKKKHFALRTPPPLSAINVEPHGGGIKLHTIGVEKSAYAAVGSQLLWRSTCE